MALAIKLPTGIKDGAGISARDAGNVLRVIQEGWVRLPAGLKQIFGKLGVTVDKTTVEGVRASNFTVSVRTEDVTATPTGGVAPFSYLWTRTDGGGHAWTINNATGPTASFTTLVAPGGGGDQAATFLCTVTDVSGATGSVSVDALCTNAGGTF